jgi:antibiotic biosynthesis monooxygenase (ABM) superfamily enzyme
MKKQARSGDGRNNARGRENGRATVIYDLELFDHMLNQLDELRQWCESLENRLWWIEEAIRLSKNNMRIKIPRWYESWLTGKIDT